MVYKNFKQKHHYMRTYINKHKSLKLQQLNNKSTLTFLMKCRNAGITPKFINDATKHIHTIFKTNYNIPSRISRSLENILQNFHLKILNLLIRQKHEIGKCNDEIIRKVENKINEHLNGEEKKQFWNSETSLENLNYIEIKNRHKGKFEKLKEEKRKELNIVHNEKWLVNKTKTIIPNDVQWLLSLGQKFALPTARNNFPKFKYIADWEDCIQTLTNKEEQEMARTKFTTMLENHMNKLNLNTRERFVLNTVEQTKGFLRKNKNIIILNADKGNVTVAMERKDYDEKMDNILNDMMTYRKLNKDPTSTLQRKNNDLVNELFRCNNITVIEKKRLKTDVAHAPRIYGLPKIHKDGCPLRPICSSINSPSIELCKFLTNILKKLTEKSEFNVRDVVQFRNKINNSAIFDDEKLVSFDVVSLFTSIPVDYAIDVIMEKWSEIEIYTNITKELFTKILKFCVKDNRYFKYKEKPYTQLNGLPMGSPASPIIADIVMEKLLQESIGRLKHKPRLLTKYVDDLFGIVRETEIEETLRQLNSIHRRIKFTIEEEKNGCLPYLDSIILRSGNKIKVNWYQKPTSSGRMLNYFSSHPKSIIMNTASNFINRILTISDKQFHKQNTRKIIDILTRNSFPKHIIKKLIHKRKNTSRIESNATAFKSTTYVSGISERIKNSSIYDKGKYSIAQTTQNTLGQIFTNMKSKIDKMEKSNLIYRIRCNGDNTNVCNKVYVGTTKNKLKTRIAGHRSDLRCRDNFNTNKTALAAHCTERKHTPNLESVEILQTENNYNRRLTLEMLHIINIPQSKRVNYKSDVDNCAHSYRQIINKGNK